eukprot:TRINITY_DN26673_c0_g1_i1.p1 TRINITY_DN26673_c0_g1~~TRINITY_DN26673_c0_g1_i1.p1  ORF type:complete len:213 (+),score=25.19 TRINITY_DN26673_c0_g1_i1:312-950(+)
MSSLSALLGNKGSSFSVVRSAPLSIPSGTVSKRALSHIVKYKESEEIEKGSEFVSGEWPVNWSLASMEDCAVYYKKKMFKEHVHPHYMLDDVMATELYTCTPESTLESLAPIFDKVSGIPVVMSPSSKLLIGMVTREDFQNSKAVKVKEIMSTPPIALPYGADVQSAACTMLKYKIHHVPVVNEHKEIVGIVTRTDIFQALELEAADLKLDD